ncbi:MAG TPA: DUF3090 domain-containing protein [Herpetosiphonaceae bacterium]
MAKYAYDLRRVNHVTAGAVGQPGQRVFYLQAQKHGDLVSMVTEKEYVRALCERLDDILDELAKRGLPRPSQADEPTPAELMLRGPLTALFRIGQLSLAYDAENDLIIIEAEELVLADEDEEIDPILRGSQPEEEPAAKEPQAVRISATRAQMQGLSRFALDIIETGGRPQCPQCLQPMDPSGHMCVKKNGHANKTNAEL